MNQKSKLNMCINLYQINNFEIYVHYLRNALFIAKNRCISRAYKMSKMKSRDEKII